MPELVASAAVRYDVEIRQDQNLVPAGDLQDFINVVAGGPANGKFFPLNPGLIQYPSGIPTKSATFQAPEPKLSLAWTPRPNVTLYASFGVGFKSGGFNSAGTDATVSNIAKETGSNVHVGDEYGEETDDAYEVGLKGTLLDKQIAYQFAGYYTQVHGMQFNEFFSTAQGLLRVDSNIDRVDLQGGEGAIQAHAANWLDLNFGANATGSEILKNSSRPNTVGNKAPYTPLYTGVVGFAGASEAHRPIYRPGTLGHECDRPDLVPHGTKPVRADDLRGAWLLWRRRTPRLHHQQPAHRVEGSALRAGRLRGQYFRHAFTWPRSFLPRSSADHS